SLLVTSLSLIYSLFVARSVVLPALHSFPTRRSSDLDYHRRLFRRHSGWHHPAGAGEGCPPDHLLRDPAAVPAGAANAGPVPAPRSEEHTSELQSRFDLVCRLLLEKKYYSN